MRIGEVNEFLEAIVSLSIYDTAGQEYSLSAMIDTGFSAELALPAIHVAGLKLPLKTARRMEMANGAEELVSFYEADIVWNGSRRTVEVCCIGAEALVGMSLLFLNRVDMHIVPQGQIFLL